jgi:hypothetical protein
MTNGNKGLSPVVVAAVAHEWAVIPVGLDKKSRVEWAPYQTERPSLKQVQRWNAELHPDAWAVVTGKISGIIVLDFDSEIGLETMRRHGIRPHERTGSGGAHQYLAHPGFHVPTWTGKKKIALQQVLPGVDIRGDGGYAVFCGRNTVGPYKRLRPLSQPDPWAGELVDKLMALMREDQARPAAREQAAGTAASVGRIPAEQILAMFLARERNGAGRNDTGFDLAVQLRDNGYSEDEAAAVMFQYAAAVKSTNTKGMREVYSAAEVRATLRSVYNRPAREPWGQKGQTVADAEADSSQQARTEDDWPQPEPLGEVLPPVLPFDEWLLPTALRPLVVDVAERMQVPLDFPAAALMLCLAGAVNRRALVQPKDADPSGPSFPICGAR